MKRREFMGRAAVLLAGVGVSRISVAASGAGHVAYTPEAFAAARASGDPLMLDFFAPW